MENRCVNSPGPGRLVSTPWLPLSFTSCSHAHTTLFTVGRTGRTGLPLPLPPLREFWVEVGVEVERATGGGGVCRRGEVGRRNVASGCKVASREDNSFISPGLPETS